MICYLFCFLLAYRFTCTFYYHVYSEEMIRGLTQVPWERVDVSFHKSTQRYVAHSTIQASSEAKIG